MTRTQGWLHRIATLALGGVLVVVEVVLMEAAVRVNGTALALSIMVFGVPGSVLWVKARDHALFWREEVERERRSEAAGIPREPTEFRDIRPEEADLVRALKKIEKTIGD